MSSFRMIALYVGNFDEHLNGQMFNFCSDYLVRAEKSETGEKKRKLRVTVTHDPVLPATFFTSGNGGENGGCVNSVSAIVGRNGSGKTTLARLFCSLARADERKGDWKVVLIYEQDGKIEVWSPMQSDELEVKNVEMIDGSCSIIESKHDYSVPPFDFYYFSPHFTTEQFDTYTVGYHADRQLGEEGDSCTDISTTWLMLHPEGNSELLLHDGVSQTAIYDADEKIRVFEFIAAWHEKDAEGKFKRDFQMPEPQGVSIGINGLSVKSALREWNRKIEDCRKEETGPQNTIYATMKSSADDLRDPVGEYYRTLIGAFENANVYASIIGFVNSIFMAYAAEYIQDCGIEHAPLSRDPKDGPYGIFLYALHDFINKWDWKETWPDVQEIISFFAEHQPIWPRRSQGRSQNSPERLFASIQELLNLCETEKEKDSPIVRLDENSNVVNCRLGNEDVLKRVCEIVRLHRLTQVISPYLKFDVLPHMSSGEMSFLSLFARLYHFIGKLNENENVVVFLDEAETTLHPEWQRRLVAYCIRFFEVFLPRRQYQLIFASHSPMLLADVPDGNVIFLGDKDHDREHKKFCQAKVTQGRNRSNTFAANIFDLYKDSFFLDKGTMGEFAAGKVKKLLDKLNPRRKDFKTDVAYRQSLVDAKDAINDDDLKVVKLVRDPFLSRYIGRRLEEIGKQVDEPDDEQIYCVSDDKEECEIKS